MPYEFSRPKSLGIIFYAEFAHRLVGILFRLSVCGNQNYNLRKSTKNMAEESNKKKVTEIGFIETEALNRYVTETGKILPRKFTGLTAKEQRHVKKTIKHARNMLLMK